MIFGDYPLLDGTYILTKINKKIEDGEDINIYEQFYLWSINNRSKVLFYLFILFIITLLVNGFNNKIMVGGNEDSTTQPDNNQETNTNGGNEDATTQPDNNQETENAQPDNLEPSNGSISIFSVINKFFLKIWKFMFTSKAPYIIAVVLFIYGFGIVIIPLIILFLIIKYSLKIYRKKTRKFKAFRRYKRNKKTK
jgi:hypothetical protein